MRVFTVTGLTGSGKTSTIEHIIKELCKRGYSVGSVKEIHYEKFRIDTEGKNTYRHRQAGASTVTARSAHETDVMYPGHMPIYELLAHYHQDFVVLEGVRDAVVPEIAVCKEDEQPLVSPLTFAISGRYSNKHKGDFLELPIINALTETEKLVDLILEKVPPLMPDMDIECCSSCGTDCRGLLAQILKGEKQYSDCVLTSSKVALKINDKEVPIVPFVENVLKNVVLGVVSELKGYEKRADITITIKDNE